MSHRHITGGKQFTVYKYVHCVYIVIHIYIYTCIYIYYIHAYIYIYIIYMHIYILYIHMYKCDIICKNALFVVQGARNTTSRIVFKY